MEFIQLPNLATCIGQISRNWCQENNDSDILDHIYVLGGNYISPVCIGFQLLKCLKGYTNTTKKYKKSGVNPCACEGQAVPVSYKTPSCYSYSSPVSLVGDKGKKIFYVKRKRSKFLNLRNGHFVNKGNNKITELRAILQRESQNS